MSLWRPYYPTQAAAQAAVEFPGALTQFEYLDRRATRYTLDPISFDVPESLQVVLPRVLSQSAITVTVAAAAREVILGASPGAGQVGWDMATGIMTFNVADDGLAAVVTFAAASVVDTSLMAGDLHKWQAELGDALDAITAVSGLDALAAGIVVKTSNDPDTYASRTLTAGTGITVTNGDGVAGNPTVAVDPATLLANPTGTVGLTAVNGSATTAMRSDGAPALSQAIVPTWTGLHTFTGGIASPVTIGTAVFRTPGTRNLVIGDTASSPGTTDNVVLGQSAGAAMVGSGFGGNVFIGFEAGRSSTTAEQCVAIGREALELATTGIANVAVGESAGRGVTTGLDNVLIGSDAGWNPVDTTGAGITTGNHNTAIGNNAGNTGTDYSGPSTFIAQTGQYNTALGANAGWGADGSAGNAQYRTAVGAWSTNDDDNQIMLGQASGLDTVVAPGPLEIRDVIKTPSATVLDEDLDLTVRDIAARDVTATGDVSGVAGTFTGAVSGTTGTFSGDVTLRRDDAASIVTAETIGPYSAVFGVFRSNGTIASPTALLGTQAVGDFRFGGYDGSALVVGARVRSIATGNFTVSNRSMRIFFQTTPSGSTTLTDRMVIEDNGRIGMGSGTALSAPAAQNDIQNASGNAIPVQRLEQLNVASPFVNLVGAVSAIDPAAAPINTVGDLSTSFTFYGWEAVEVNGSRKYMPIFDYTP